MLEILYTNLAPYTLLRGGKIGNPVELTTEILKGSELSATKSFYLAYLLSTASIRIYKGYIYRGKDKTELVTGVYLDQSEKIISSVEKAPEDYKKFVSWFLEKHFDTNICVESVYIEKYQGHKPWTIPGSLWVNTTKDNYFLILSLDTCSDSIHCIPIPEEII